MFYYRNRPILKTLGQFENSGFVIMSTRENIRLIARAPLLKSDVPRKIISTIYFPIVCNSYEISKIIALLTHICLASFLWNIDK